MVSRISRETLNNLRPTFDTPEEEAAYNAEVKAANDAYLKETIEKLKALYEGKAGYTNYEDSDWETFARQFIQKNRLKNFSRHLNSLPSYNLKPNDPAWAQFSYEEILEMEANGVLIPKEMLAWAHSMQDSDVTAYVVNDDPQATEEIEKSTENSGKGELTEMQKKTQTLSQKALTSQTEMDQKFDTFEELAERAQEIKEKQEKSKNDSLKQIEKLTKEWQLLSKKAEKGGSLSKTEESRYRELGTMLNGKDGELVTSVSATSDELQNLINSMDELSIDIQEGVELGNNTLELAKQLSKTEKGNKSKFLNTF